MFEIQDWIEDRFAKDNGKFVRVEDYSFTNHVLAHQKLKELKMRRTVTSKAIVVLIPKE